MSFFLSYSHKDAPFAEGFTQDLRDRGHTVWRDEDNIRIGQSIRRAIEGGLAGSRFVIVVVSKTSVKSEWCQKELDMALTDETAKRIRVLPIVIDDCEIPLVLQGKRYLVFKDHKRDLRKFLSLLPADSV